MRTGKRKRLWALLLSAALIVTQLPAVAMAENNTPEDGSIASFEPLDSGVANQTVEVGTELSALNLPDAVRASVYQVTEDIVIPDKVNGGEAAREGALGHEDSTEENDDPATASPSNAENSVSEGNAGDSSDKDSGKTVTTVTTSTEEIPVTWDSEPAYDGNTAGSYVFTADVGGYALSSGAKLPQITVTVTEEIMEMGEEIPPQEPLPCTLTEGCTLADGHKGECVPAPPANDDLEKTIIGWTFVATGYSDYAGGELTLPIVSMDNQADFDTVVSMLPTHISVEIEGEAEPSTLDITAWGCPEYIQDGDGNWPLTGDYTFTAVLLEGYALASDAEALEVLVTFGGGASYSIDGDGYSFDQLSGNLTISSYAGTTNWRNNTSINKADVLSLTIPDTMTSIGNNAFSGCTGLTSIDNLPAGLTSIGKSTFWNCTGLTSIDNLPAGLTSIGDYTFSGCTGLTSIGNLPAGLTSIGDYTFSDCTGLTSIDNLPAGLTSIGNNTFSGCTGLTSIDNLPAGLTSIGESTFSGCTGLTNIDNLPAGLTSIGSYTFRNCTGLTSIDNLPAGLTSIGGATFSYCTGLTSIDNLPAGLTSIGDYMFDGCTGLTEIIIPEGVTSIGGWALSGCTNLKTIVFLRKQAPTFGTAVIPSISPAPVVYVPEGASGYESLSVQTVTMTAPAIAAQPQDVTVTAGITATFTVTADGTPFPSYQWQVNTGSGWSDVTDGTGGNTDSYTTPATNMSMNDWQYQCVITNIKDTVTTSAVTLTVNALTNAETPAITEQPKGGTYTQNTSATLTVTANVSDGGTLTYQWYSNTTDSNTGGKAISDADTASYTAPTGAIGTTYYYVVVTNTNNGVNGNKTATATSNTAGVTVNTLVNAETPAITNQPKGGIYTQNASVTLSVTANVRDGGTLSYQWYSNTTDSNTGGKAISGADTASYTAPTGTAGTTYYYVVVTNTNDSVSGQKTANVASSVAAVTVKKESSNTGGNGVSSSYTEPEPQSIYTVTGEIISLSVSRSDLKKLADDRKSLTLRCDKASMTFDPAALKAILAAVPSTAGNITFTAAPADLSAFPDAAKLIGSRPVYNFTISYKDSLGNPVTVPVNFPAGSAAITLTYTPAATEVTGSLFMVYVDGKGAVTWLDKSSYNNGKVLAAVPHFSTYGVAYKTPVPVFTDITSHWAKEDIEFVAARGLLSGTGEKLFSPDAAMTRGMFVTALGRLSGVNPDSYKTRSFTDVKADAYYAAYVEWAVKKDIVKGTGEGLFSPDAPVTREQMAVMMTNYAGQMGYSIPAPLAAVTFADGDKISAWAAKEVAAMQRAGIIKGKDGNRFAPQASATRAEVSAVLRRFVEIVIDPVTATGWVKNDSGHRLYYKGGKALTGWQTIGRLRYFFNADGVMHEGWKQDTDTNKWYYWTSAGAATSWREIGGKWYYFDENGVMAVNTKIDGYEVGPDGAGKEN